MLASGTRLGPYEITAPLGAGGMGEVYRARDTRLDRMVAVKVLPEAFSRDSSFRRRLELEGRAISQLSHPHICTLHDIGEQDGTAFLVMELLEGETLADRLRRQAGQGLRVEDAVAIATQMAGALAAAHHRGIVHRDLKPGNVMITRGGPGDGGRWSVKLLDFGLAKLTDPRVAAAAASAVTSPPAVTAEGTLLGTFQYMAPEQLEGRPVDARTDVFALGCVLYEMLTGTRSFDGRSPASIIAAILEREPVPMTALRPDVPQLVAAITNRCLAKSPEDRWQSAADLCTALRIAADAGLSADARGAVPGRDRSGRRTIIGTALLATAALVAGAAGSRLLFAPRAEPLPETRLELMPPPGMAWSASPAASTVQLALSPDGRQIALVAAPRRGVPRLWVRPLNSTQARVLAGTEDAAFPFWSPDGHAIGFFAGGKLKIIDTAGGAPQVLADAPIGRGGSWNADGVILFSPAPNRGIWRVAAAGGASSAVLERPADAVITHVWPQFLADGHRFIFYQRSEEAADQGVYSSDLTSRQVSQVIRNDGLGVIASGRLFFVRDGTLFGQMLDEASLRPAGDPERIADSVGYTLGTTGYSPVSAAGTVLAYGPAIKLETVVEWRDRAGAALGAPVARGVYRSPRLSPDGRQVLLTILDDRATSTDISILDLVRGTSRMVTRDPATDWFPVWGPRGDRVYFGAARRRATAVYERGLTGADTSEQPLLPVDVARYPVDATGDDRLVVQAGSNGYDLGVSEINGDRTPNPIVASPYNEVQGRVSPNRRWIAYSSDESGRFEVYVRAFPSGADLTLISPAGGMQPEWRADGRELFYVSSDRKLTSVAVTTDSQTFSAGVPRPLFEVNLPEPTAPYPGDYAVSADGQRFLLNSLVDQAQASPLTIIQNWTPGRRE